MRKYLPLVTLILIALAQAFALTHGIGGNWLSTSHFLMGFLLSQFAMLKLFHLSGFAEGFQKYDLIAMRCRSYALIYPFIELGLGLGYLSFFSPVFIYLVTVIVTAIGSIGVITALKKGLDLKCACMGTILNVPLSTVTLTEDIGMGLMAFIMLLA